MANKTVSVDIVVSEDVDKSALHQMIYRELEQAFPTEWASIHSWVGEDDESPMEGETTLSSSFKGRVEAKAS